MFSYLLLSLLSNIDRCGTSLTADGAEQFLYRQQTGMYDQPIPLSSGIITVYVKVHSVTYSNGSGLVTDFQAEQTIANLNTGFEGTGFQFVLLDGVVAIPNDEWVGGLLDLSPIVTDYPQTPYAANVYFFPEFFACGVGTFTTDGPWGDLRFVGLKPDCVLAPLAPVGQDVEVVSHEFGHFFDLLHTHETASGQACVDGLNCAEAGDFCCDTPADPNLQDTQLFYPGCVVFPNSTWGPPCGGDQWQPDPTNFMSYAGVTGDSRCQTLFTEDQKKRMYNSVVNLQRRITDLDPASCCLPDGSCSTLSEGACAIAGGIFSGTEFQCGDSSIPCGPPACPADLDGNGSVDFNDLTRLRSSYGLNADADLDGDGSTSFPDLTIMLSVWGGC